MKRLIFLSLIGFLFVGCSNNPSLSNSKKMNIATVNANKFYNVKREYFTGGKIKKEFLQSDKTGLNGYLRIYGFGGKITSTMPIQNGVKNGSELLYDTYGRILRKTPYINGSKTGNQITYYSSGQIMLSIPYSHNLKNGTAIAYNLDGSINKKQRFHKGKAR